MKADMDGKSHTDSVADIIVRRGAQNALLEIVLQYGANVIMKVPSLWSVIATPLDSVDPANPLKSNMDIKSKQLLVDGLQILEIVAPAFVPSLLPYLSNILEKVFGCLQYPCRGLRFTAARTLAVLASIPYATSEFVQKFITCVIPLLSDPVHVINRQGAVEALSLLATKLQLDIIPYIVLLIIPLLGRLSDFDTSVRLVASSTFATLLRYMPLESGVPNPPGMSVTLVNQKFRERRFLEQLLDPTALDKYEVPVGIKADLRSYQQRGIDWMHFLNKYCLHGILCDDMGLGKTLQTICIIAGDHYDRSVVFSKSNNPDHRHLLSLVVCPPTLIRYLSFGHLLHMYTSVRILLPHYIYVCSIIMH